MLNVAETNIQHVIRIVNPGMCEIKHTHTHTHTHLNSPKLFELIDLPR